MRINTTPATRAIFAPASAEIIAPTQPHITGDTLISVDHEERRMHYYGKFFANFSNLALLKEVAEQHRLRAKKY